MELSCQTLRTTYQAREAVRTGSAGRPGVLVAMVIAGGGGGKRETHTSAHARGKGRAVRRREGGAGGDMAAEAGQAVTGEGWRPSGSSV